MKIKVGDKVYDGDEVPIMIIMNKKDKENIANMPEDATKYAVFSFYGWSESAIRAWMSEGL